MIFTRTSASASYDWHGYRTWRPWLFEDDFAVKIRNTFSGVVSSEFEPRAVCSVCGVRCGTATLRRLARFLRKHRRCGHG